MRFVHVGIHKTGSTLLQDALFDDLADCVVIGTPSAPAGLHEHCRLLWSRDDGELDLREWRYQFNRLLGEYGFAPDRVALSDENLSGHLWTGAGRIRNAQRLARLWPNTRILIVLRDPLDYVLSAYDEYCRLGGASGLFTLLRDRITPGVAILRRLDYQSLVATYEELFGQDQVLVLPYEFLVDKPHEFAGVVTRHCGIATPPLDVDIDYNPRSAGWRRALVRVSNFVNLPRGVNWRRRRRRNARRVFGDKVRRWSAWRLDRVLWTIDDPDGLLPRGRDVSTGFQWNGAFAVYQDRYSRGGDPTVGIRYRDEVGGPAD